MTKVVNSTSKSSGAKPAAPWSRGDYKEIARKLRLEVVRMVNRAQSAHIGGSFSMMELLVVLFGEVLRIRPDQPGWPERDRFLLSKGHACAGLYAILCERGFFPRDWLETFYADGGKLPGHATCSVPGVEVSTGALGHGLPIACGIALAHKRDGDNVRVFCMISDGECDEGSTWEAALFAPQHKLDNLVCIVDYNKVQSLGLVEEVLDLHPLAAKWRDFRWNVREIDGHDFTQIQEALNAPPEPGRPTCIVAHTVKGKGVSFMEGKLLWHYRIPAGEEMERAIEEINAK
jgi:transketolase